MAKSGKATGAIGGKRSSGGAKNVAAGKQGGSAKGAVGPKKG
jgi:hypothetical protein